jgi:protein-S-isoprenylcysteine O-methyltransferase Ste14
MLRLPPPIWAMIFLGACAGLSWVLGWPMAPWPHHEAVGMVVFFASWILPVWAFRKFRLAGAELDPTSESSRAFITDGPFRLTRNPMYLGLTGAALGMAIWVGTWPMLAAPVATFFTANFVHVPFEEAKLRRQFGEAFDAYTRHVRRWL